MAQEPIRGEDITINIKIDSDEARVGVTKIIALKKDNKKEEIKIKIPTGTKNGQKLRVTGKGKTNNNTGLSGDLFLQIEVIPAVPTYQLYRINLFQALLGGTVEIDTPNGEINVQIPSEVQNGEKIVLPQMGEIIGDSKERKNLEVEFKILLPHTLTEEQKKKILELKELFENSL